MKREHFKGNINCSKKKEKKKYISNLTFRNQRHLSINLICRRLSLGKNEGKKKKKDSKGTDQNNKLTLSPEPKKCNSHNRNTPEIVNKAQHLRISQQNLDEKDNQRRPRRTDYRLEKTPSQKTTFCMISPTFKSKQKKRRKTHMELHINYAAEDVRREIINSSRAVIHHLLQMPLRKIHHEAPLPGQRNERTRTRVPELQTNSRRRWRIGRKRSRSRRRNRGWKGRRRRRRRRRRRVVFESIVDGVEIDTHQTHKE